VNQLDIDEEYGRLIQIAGISRILRLKIPLAFSEKSFKHQELLQLLTSSLLVCLRAF